MRVALAVLIAIGSGSSAADPDTPAPGREARVGAYIHCGIWNVDRGTPILSSLYRPEAQSNEILTLRRRDVRVVARTHDGKLVLP